MKENTEELEKDMIPLLIQDLGLRFPTPKSKKKIRYGKYKCPHCEKEFEASSKWVKNGKQQSCGCLRGKNYKGKKDRLYRVWVDLKSRCTKPNNALYKYYGRLGIKVCEEWIKSYDVFKEWSLKKGYTEELTIDRLDDTGNYDPSNCRWVIMNGQNQNTRELRSNNKDRYRGVTKRNKGWVVHITVNTKRVFLGSFKTDTEGAIAYNKYVIDNNLKYPLNVIPEI